jgi:hypothetical protein
MLFNTFKKINEKFAVNRLILYADNETKNNKNK